MAYYQSDQPHVLSDIREVDSQPRGRYSSDDIPIPVRGYPSDDIPIPVRGYPSDDIPIPEPRAPPVSPVPLTEVKNCHFQEVPIEQHPYWNPDNFSHSIPLSHIPPPPPPVKGTQTRGIPMNPLPPARYRASNGAGVQHFKPSKTYRQHLIWMSLFAAFLSFGIVVLGIFFGLDENELAEIKKQQTLPVQTPTKIVTVTTTISVGSGTTITNTITEPARTVTDLVTSTFFSTIFTCEDKNLEPFAVAPKLLRPKSG